MSKIRNPWRDLDVVRDRFLIHKDDAPHVLAYNKLRANSKNFTIATHVPPLPYVGNPSAPIVILLANPGLSRDEANPNFRLPKKLREANQANLLHKRIMTSEGKRSTLFLHMQGTWWRSRLRRLIEESSTEVVSEGVFFANFHPYHSKSWKNINFTLPTQHYTFDLIRNAIDSDAYVLMSRNTEGWMTSIPELLDYPRKSFFNSSRSVHISPKNVGSKTFRDLIRLL